MKYNVFTFFYQNIQYLTEKERSDPRPANQILSEWMTKYKKEKCEKVQNEAIPTQLSNFQYIPPSLLPMKYKTHPQASCCAVEWG